MRANVIRWGSEDFDWPGDPLHTAPRLLAASCRAGVAGYFSVRERPVYQIDRS